MSKRHSVKYKIDRRMGENIWGRPKSPANKREYGPGQHGQRRKGKLSDFGVQLRAKQKLKGYYGNISEKQFRKVYDEASRMKGDTSENLIGLLERRLDAIIYRAKFVPTVFAARQFINHGHVKVNGKRVNIPSYRVRPGDVIEVRDRPSRWLWFWKPSSPQSVTCRTTSMPTTSKMTATYSRVPAFCRCAVSGADGTEPGHRILFALIIGLGRCDFRQTAGRAGRP
jgi:small subunit ribosomal protein S4